MPRHVAILAGLVAVIGALIGTLSVLRGGASGAADAAETPAAASAPVTEDERERAAREHAAMLDRDYPMHAGVTKAQVVVRARPEPEATQLGWLRLGEHLRVKSEPTQTPTCRSGWYELYPRGFACAGQGLEVGAAFPAALEGLAADRETALPYHYYFVKEPQVPEWHQLPSRDDQRDAQLHAERYLALLADDERRAVRLRAGELPGEPVAPREVARWLDHGFWIASNGSEVRSRRRFVRTVRGSYVKDGQLEERTGSDFQGIALEGELTLPVAWTIRAARPMVRRERADRSVRLVEETLPADEGAEPQPAPAIARLTRVEWRRRERIGDQQYHVVAGADGEDRWLRDWFVTVAERRDPPSGVAADEPWVHVDISSQTLVVYRGPTPIYATLVSSGVEGHDTPIGEFTVRRKMVTDTMADLGPEAGDDRYRIEDVPWTQYFEGSIALHAAFWHGQFGIPRSHGCVNLAPRDAQQIFLRTWPEVPASWHGISTEQTGVRGSRVVVTE